jgi:hypothetical protein
MERRLERMTMPSTERISPVSIWTRSPTSN